MKFLEVWDRKGEKMVVAEFKNDNYTSVYGLKQWDFGQELLIKGTGIQGKTVEVHFALERDNVALRMLGTVENGNITVLIPDTLLQVGNSIYAYVYQSGERVGKTTHKIFMYVSPRAKPEDYTEKEFKNALQQVLAIAQSVREDADAGNFNATDEQIRKVVDTYMSNHPIEKIETDKTLSIEDKAADAKATGDKILQYAIKNTVSGESPLTITDSAEEKLQDLKLLGKTEQLSTKGVQLIPFPYIDKDMTKNGITFIVQQDGGVKVSGNATDESVFILANIDYGNESIFNNNIGNGKVISGGKDNVVVEYNGLNKKTYIMVGSGKSVNTVIYPQVQYGSTATPYEPYTGGQPSPSPEYTQEIKSVGKYNEETGKYEVDVKVTGKNLLDLKKYTLNHVSEVQQGEIQNDKIVLKGNRYSQFKVKVKKGKTYVLSAKNNSNNSYIQCYESFLGDNSIFSDFGKPYGTINMSLNKIQFVANTDYICLYFYPSSLENFVTYYDIMLSYLSDTDYEPYKEQTLTLTSDRPVTKWDKLVEQDGQIGWLYSTKKYTVTGKESWIFGTADYYAGQSTNMYTAIKDANGSEGVSERLSCVKSIWDSKDKSGFFILGQQFHMRFYNTLLGVSDDATKEEKQTAFKAYLVKEYESETPYELFYKSEQTEFVPLTQDQQDAIRALKTYYPTTVISTDGGEVNPDIEVTYVADTKNYIDNKVSTNVANIISQYQTNLEKYLSLMPLSVQAGMVETDVNNILKNMEEMKHE